MIKRFAAAAVVLLGLSPAAHALEFQPLGAGSLGVGGAGVARNYGALAPYWNPAGLAFAPKTVTVSLVAGVGLEPKGKLAQDLDDLSTTHKAWDSDQTNLTKANALADAINQLIATTGKDNLRLTAGAAVGAQVKHLGFGVFGTFEGGAIPNPGGSPIPTPLSLAITQPQIDAALNSKTVNVRGILLLEAPLSYGYAFDLGSAGKLGVGVTGKYLYGEATSKPNQQVFDSTSNSTVSSTDLTHDLSKNRKGTSSFGIDLGLLWKPLASTSIGLVAKNLNAPSFDTATGEKIVVDRQVRAGMSYEPLSWLELTADVDVIPNTTVVPGIKTQHLGGGAEFHPFSCLKLRAGGYTDLAASTSGAVTAGLSLGIPWVYFDLDAAYGLGTVKYNKDSYPTEAKVQFSTNLAF
jgi:hypothetical protein